MKINESILNCFKKSFWTDCYFQVQDIGNRTCWGQIIDGKTGKLISLVSVFPLNDNDWIEYDEAQQLITSLPTKND